MPLVEHHLHINGQDVPAASGRTFLSTNPATGQAWASFAEAGAADVDAAVTAARAAFDGPAWRGLTPTRRGRLMMRLADLIAAHAEEIAAIEVRENGKLYKEMLAQLRVIPDWLYYFGGLADKIEGRVIPLDRQTVLNYTVREPLGVVGIITPWNSPSFINWMSAAPATATLVASVEEFAFDATSELKAAGAALSVSVDDRLRAAAAAAAAAAAPRPPSPPELSPMQVLAAMRKRAAAAGT